MKMKIMVFGAAGMLGNAVLRYFATQTGHDLVGVVRSVGSANLLPTELQGYVVEGGDADDFDSMVRLFDQHRPTVVINCIGLVKQHADSSDPLLAVPINSLLPHRLARLCSLVGARFIHLSTDCVFSGAKGMYVEEDVPDAIDVYGRTKLLGEVSYPNSLTLRTSIIGHELQGSRSLISWFLSQETSVRGYSNAIFSGLPTVEIARIIEEFVLPQPELRGLYHLSSEPISKYSLLQLVAEVYGKVIQVEEEPSFVIDRSLDSSRFRGATGFLPEAWPELVKRMKNFS